MNSILSGRFLWAIVLSCVWTAELGLVAAERVPILGWHSIPEQEISLERFRELAEMGLTHSLMHYSAEGNRRALDYAAEVGVKLFVGDSRFESVGEGLEEAVRLYRDHPALAGYTLRDEPSLGAFAGLAGVREAIGRLDPDHWSYVNLLPTYANAQQLGCESYPEHVRRFMVEYRPEVLSFDHYGILEGDRLRGDYFQNLEWIRQASVEHGVPFWAFALTCPHRPYPLPTAGHIRFQAWSDFAYGAKGLQYFTYWTPRPGTWDFHDAPIREDGTRSPTYELLREFNRDVQACGELILRGRVVGVYHTEPLPAGTRGLDVSSPFVRLEGGGALVSVLVMPDRSRHVLVVNRSFVEGVELRGELASWVQGVGAGPEVAGARLTQVDGRMVVMELEAGAGLFLRLL